MTEWWRYPTITEEGVGTLQAGQLMRPDVDYTPPETVKALTAIEVAKPVPIRPDDMYVESLVPPLVAAPTLNLVGELNGGTGIPWTAGPASLSALPIAIGSLLIYAGSRMLGAMKWLAPKAIELSGGMLTFSARGFRVAIHTGMSGSPGAGAWPAHVKPRPNPNIWPEQGPGSQEGDWGFELPQDPAPGDSEYYYGVPMAYYGSWGREGGSWLQ